MGFYNSFKKIVSNKSFRRKLLCLFAFVPDKTYLEIAFKARMGYKLDLKNPKTMNEKLQWLKINDHNPSHIIMADKYEAKKYITETLGEEYVIKNLGVWNDAREIDFDSLPEKFVLKCTHDSGTIVVCTDKSNFDKEAAIKKLNKGLKLNYYLVGREWPYKKIKPRIIAEEYMTDTPDSKDFTDYKFSCFNGYADSVMLCLDRSSGKPKFYLFDKEWKLVRCNPAGKEAPEDFTIPKPEKMDEMFEIAEKLSEGIPYVRVDLYLSNGQIYFGELTFFPQSGFDSKLERDFDIHCGELIDLGLAKK